MHCNRAAVAAGPSLKVVESPRRCELTDLIAGTSRDGPCLWDVELAGLARDVQRISPPVDPVGSHVYRRCGRNSDDWRRPEPRAPMVGRPPAVPGVDRRPNGVRDGAAGV